MSPQRAQNTSLMAIAAAASSTSPTPTPANNATSVIIGVTVSVGLVVLLIVAFRIWRCTRPPKAPFPPKGPLAHDRQRHMVGDFSQSELQSQLPTRTHGFMPLAQNAPYSRHSHQASSRTDVASIPPSSPSVVSSQAHLVSESDENMETIRGRRPSLANPSSPRRHLHGYRSRTISNTGSVRSTRSRQSSQGTIRGPPHLHHINIVLPQPLASGLNNNTHFRQPPMPYRRAYPVKKRSESCDRGALFFCSSPVDRWLTVVLFSVEYRFRRVSMDDSSSSTHDSVPHTTPQSASAENTHPLPPLPNGSLITPSTPRRHVSNAPAPDILSPNASVPLLTEPCPSPDYGPPPLPPPKDPQPRYSSRRRRHSESASGRQRP